LQKVKRLNKFKKFWFNEKPKQQKSRSKKTLPYLFDNVPEIVIERLPVYIRILSKLQEQGKEKISSKILGELSGISPAIIRKDLNYFGGFGKQGVGYQIKELKEILKTILGLDGTWTVGVIGANAGFRIVALFDTNKSLHGNKIGRITIQPLEELERSVKTRNIKIAIIATPSNQSQKVVNKLVASNIKCILNYSQSSPKVPDGIILKPVDPISTLQSMAFHLKNEHLTNNHR
jgi:redox-sensing transcriptional repressor